MYSKATFKFGDTWEHFLIGEKIVRTRNGFLLKEF